MNDTSIPAEGAGGDPNAYEAFIAPVAEALQAFDEGEKYPQRFAGQPRRPALLFAAHWCKSAMSVAGFRDFFQSAAGVLAPEAVAGFRSIGMPQTAQTVENAMQFLGKPYPRDQIRRCALLDRVEQMTHTGDGLFEDLDGAFYRYLALEAGGFEVAANRFAALGG